MTDIVLRVRLTSGDQTDVSYQDPEAPGEDEAIERALRTLSTDSGYLRCRHGDRLVVLFARGVAGLEVAPRGAIL